MKAEIYRALKQAVEAERLVALATVVAGPGSGRQLLVAADGEVTGGLGSSELDRRAAEAARERFATFGTARIGGELDGQAVDLFVETVPPRPKLVVVGAVHVAIPLVGFARTLGFRTYVIDPRSAFATPERFSHADELIVSWPGEAFERVGLNEASCVAVLTHDLKIDVPALSLALRSPARFVGALGSRKTHAGRVQALRRAGHTDEEIARIHAPIGLDLGGRRPEEIAVSIIAQMVAAGHGLPGGS